MPVETVCPEPVGDVAVGRSVRELNRAGDPELGEAGQVLGRQALRVLDLVIFARPSAPPPDARPAARRSTAAHRRRSRRAGRAPRPGHRSRSRPARRSRAASGRSRCRRAARPRAGRRGRDPKVRARTGPSRRSRARRSGGDPPASGTARARSGGGGPCGSQASRVASKASSAFRFAWSPIAWTPTGQPRSAPRRMISSSSARLVISTPVPSVISAVCEPSVPSMKHFR